ncbi:autophagy protein [Grosmannia clavigera kw1407]|uniref:Autophagy-related protein 27 n=1 Tax=Grosmannia clavigera (strain kw1407 / UAMH 11150) TaxID=655863 RepID=F0X6Z9_GROCL|nr:autophagy protein [Grosmannia clavigera kw1407]EFX06284.1 autophagy protein [Grosmannia clavigera kw1407]
MKWTISASSASLVLLGALTAQPAAAMLQCGHIQADGQRFDLSALKGPHSVLTTQHTPPTDQNTTYTIDLCGPLKRKGDVPKGEECPNGSWACAIRRFRNAEGVTGIGQVIPLAGNLEDQGGSALSHTATRLKTADSNADAQREGLRLVLQGGRYPLDGPVSDRQNQRVIVELLCDKTREGTEGEWIADEYERDGTAPGSSAPPADPPSNSTTSAAGLGFSLAQEGPAEKQLLRDGEAEPALVFQGYDVHDTDGSFGTLRLAWHTRYACEGAARVREHWGFFTWFVILVFLATAAYLIFGSWLNYNRYGARGWDLLPHGDTLRDVPYLLRDWVRRLINTLQGSGSRGGYSAV